MSSSVLKCPAWRWGNESATGNRRYGWQTELPATMVHKENDRTVTVEFDAVIRFTKTVINPPIDPSLFTIAKPSLQ